MIDVVNPEVSDFMILATVKRHFENKETLTMVALFEYESGSDLIAPIFVPVRLGGCLDIDPDKPATLEQCVGNDCQGNSVEMLKSLHESGHITLTPDPENPSRLEWEFEIDDSIHVHVNANGILNFTGLVELLNMMVEEAVPGNLIS